MSEESFGESRQYERNTGERSYQESADFFFRMKQSDKGYLKLDRFFLFPCLALYFSFFFCHIFLFWLFLRFTEFQRRQFLEKLGESFLMAVLEEYSGVLPSLGSDLHGFLHNLGSVFQEMKGNSNVTNSYDISFSCVPEQRKLTLHFRTAAAACGYVWAGVLKVNYITPSFVTILIVVVL